MGDSVAAVPSGGDGPKASPGNIRICLVREVVDDQETLSAAKHFGVPLVTSETGEEFALGNHEWTTYFILKDFEGPLFEALSKSPNKYVRAIAQSIVHFIYRLYLLQSHGSTRVEASRKELGASARQHQTHLQLLDEGSDHLFHGNTQKRRAGNLLIRIIRAHTLIHISCLQTRLVNLIHAMGGSIRKDMNSKVTHLICNAAGGDKYKYAITFRLGVVRPAWVEESWSCRDAPDFMATKDEFSINHRLKVFEGQRICFNGFPAEEHAHMEEVLRSNGGIPSSIGNPECTHVVSEIACLLKQHYHIKVPVPS